MKKTRQNSPGLDLANECTELSGDGGGDDDGDDDGSARSQEPPNQPERKTRQQQETTYATSWRNSLSTSHPCEWSVCCSQP